jgi:site-specific recombinase XerD
MNIENELELYLFDVKKKNYSKTTLNSYQRNIIAFLDYFGHKDTPADISISEIETYLMAWELVPNTHYSKINSLKSFYDVRGIKEVSFAGFDMPKRIKTIPTRISHKVLIDAIDDLDNRKHKAFLSLAYSTGMWLTEIINLELADIDFEKNTILVRGINKKKNRKINISDEMCKILLFYIKKFQPKKYLFNGQFKVQYEKNSALSIVKKNVGHKYNFHTVRNSHIYSLVESGASFKAIAKHLGLEPTNAVKRLSMFKKQAVIRPTKIQMPM